MFAAFRCEENLGYSYFLFKIHRVERTCTSEYGDDHNLQNVKTT